MMYKLVGFRKGSFTDKNTGELIESCTLHLVRKPNLRENGHIGLVCISTAPIYGESVSKLPKLVEGTEYDCDIGYSKGRYYLNDMKAV